MYTEEPHYERGQGNLVRSSCGPIGQLEKQGSKFIFMFRNDVC